MVAVGSLDAVAAFLAATEAIFLHEPRHAVAPMAAAFFAQFLLDARSAIGFPAARMNLVDLLGQGLIFHGARARTGAPLLPARLLKPLGNPQPHSVKFFAASELLEQAKDWTWLVKVTNAVNQHWQKRNAARKNCLENGSQNGHVLPAGHSSVVKS